MDAVTKKKLRELAGRNHSWCTSILMPTHRTEADNRQDPIRLKNLLRQAEELLGRRDVRPADARAMLEPAARLLDDALFWKHQYGGLALFVWPGGFEQYRVPYTLQERVVVDGRLRVVPLLPLVTDDARFFILALSGESVRLLEATRDTVSPRPLPDAPQNFDDLGRFIDEQKQLQYHTGAAPADNAGRRAAVFHGHGGAGEKDMHKVRLEEYCRWINRALERVLALEKAPLVLSADKTLMAIFRQLCSYRYVLDEGVVGNPDPLRPDQLRQRAWELVAPRLEKLHERAVDAYRQAAARDQATDRLDEVLRAAFGGRVAALMVDRGAEQWGRFEPGAGSAEMHTTPQPDDSELINLAASMAVQQDADVFAWPPERMPTGAPAAAVYRY